MSQTRITGEYTKGYELEKRFYLPGIKVYAPCPSCGVEAEFDGSDVYLSYPKVRETESLNFYCQDCDKDFYTDVIINITLSLPE